MQRVTTRVTTRITAHFHNGMRYQNHNLNMLPTLNCTFSLSLAWFGGYLQRVTTRYRHFFFLNINILFFI